MVCLICTRCSRIHARTTYTHSNRCPCSARHRRTPAQNVSRSICSARACASRATACLTRPGSTCSTTNHTPGPLTFCERLKQAGRKLRNKCYDCMPLLVHHLCDIKVPVLSDREITIAMDHFAVIDAAFPRPGSFMSYAYALEFILLKMERVDMLPFLSGIQCVKRRAHYHQKLTRIFRDATAGGIRIISGPKRSGSGSTAGSCVSSKTADQAQTQPPGGSIYQQLLGARAQCKSD